MKLRNLLALLALVGFTGPVMAQDGAGSGNGGDVVRMDILSIREIIYDSCDIWDTFKKANVDCTVLRAKMDEVGVDKNFKLQKYVYLADKVYRSGTNFPAIPQIVFSREYWVGSNVDTAAKVGIETHEYLGLMGLEKTDDHHISSPLAAELRSKWTWNCMATCIYNLGDSALYHPLMQVTVVGSGPSEHEALARLLSSCNATAGKPGSLLATSVSQGPTFTSSFDHKAACGSN